MSVDAREAEKATFDGTKSDPAKVRNLTPSVGIRPVRNPTPRNGIRPLDVPESDPSTVRNPTPRTVENLS
jgi:hypothetical protein